MPKTCSVDGCSNESRAKELCWGHYLRLYRTGSIMHPTLGASLRQVTKSRDSESYMALHVKRSADDPASNYQCIDCGAQASEWTYQYGCPDERHSEYGPYCAHNEHYAPRCHSCHTKQATPRGECHHSAKLTEDLVRYIRAEADAGRDRGALATELGVDRSTINKVVRKVIWRHVT